MGGAPGYNYNQDAVLHGPQRRDDPKEIARLLIKLVHAEGGAYVGEAALIRVFEKRWDQLNVLAHRLHRAVGNDMTAVQRAAMKADRQRVWPTGGHPYAEQEKNH